MISVNGREEALEAGTTVAQYLEWKAYRPDRVAVELNGAILPKNRYVSQVLADGDQMEVVSFVGGG